ncbi:MAG: M48 family metalloprotease, partial [Bacteroidaceae bacterium]|nr:M48 family metalloprotease [Bacteroidaceae bacterium]
MKYVGIYSQQVGNNIKSMLLLLCFPLIIVGLVWLFFFILDFLGGYDYANVPGRGMVYIADSHLEFVTYMALQTLPWIAGAVTIWFIIAYFTNTSIIRHATGARPLERRENPRVYNIVENLTMTCGMDMPKVNVIDTPELNAFASGIDRNSYTVTVTTGLCDCLNDKELEGVIAHELTHIR